MASDTSAPTRIPASGETPSRTTPFKISEWLIEPSLHRISGAAGATTVEPKMMQVLVCLAREPGRVFSKEEILQQVWNGTSVSDDVLTRAVAELRKIFGDSAATPRIIETIRKSGYRLIAPVAAVGAGEEAEETGPKASARLPRWLLAGIFVIGAALVGLPLLRTRTSLPAGPMRIRPLTASPGNERDPAVSPDGTRVAYVWNGGAGQDYSLYVQLLDGGNPLRLTQVTEAEDRLPVWSPDGQKLVFTRTIGADCQIFAIAALGGAESRIAPCGDREYRRLAWSPDGRWLVYPRRVGSAPLALELVSIETLERRPLTRPPSGLLGDTSPAFSPDGKTVAFSRNISDGAGDLYRVPVSGGQPTRLTFDSRDTIGLDWSSDGQSLIFSSSRAGIYSLWRVSASGGEPMWFAGGGTKMKHPSSARGRNVIAFENWTYEVNLWRVASGAGSPPVESLPLRLTQTTDQWNFQPHLSPDGTRIAFVSTRSGEEELWVETAAGQAPARLTSFAGARLETPRWSTDGRRLLFSARLRGRADLYAIGADGGAVQRLTSEPTDAVAPSWSRDGRSVTFASSRGGSWQVWRLHLADRRMSRVTTDGGYASRESPDGRWLYFTRAESPGIWRQPIDGGAAVRIVDSLAPEDWANWELGPDGLYFRELCASHPEPALAFLPFAGGSLRHLAVLKDQGWAGISVSPDGSSIVYPRADRHSCEIRLIENFL